MLKLRTFLLAIVCCCVALLAIPAAQDFSGANQSNDPCYKIKQMKKFIMASQDYKKAFGSRDPAYIQCYPLTINVEWNLDEENTHMLGKDYLVFDLEEEYPAYLELYYGGFDKLKKNEWESFDILGPEPCYAPCPGKGNARLNVYEGKVICCVDYPTCSKKRLYNLNAKDFGAVPASDSGYGSLHFRGESSGLLEGKITSSELSINKSTVIKTCGRFWDPFAYKLSVGQTGVNLAMSRELHSQDALTAEEIFEGLRVGQLKKVYQVAAQETEPLPLRDSYTIKGTVTVTIAFGPIEEQRWRVEVKAWERDKFKPPIKYKDGDGQLKELPIWMELDHQFAGEFVVRKIKTGWDYKEGTTTQYKGSTSLFFYGTDLYKCAVVDCPGATPGDWAGAILGQMEGQSVRLTWPLSDLSTKACVMCTPLRSFLGKLPFREEFGSGQLKYSLDKEILPLKNGYTKNVQVKDWLKYTITLTRIK